MRIKINMESVTNVAVLCAAIVFIATMGKIWLTPSQAAAGGPPPRYTKGDVVVDLVETARASYGTSEKALFVFVNSNCTYCTASMPFYARLLALGKGDGRVPIVFASREAATTTRGYLSSHGLTDVAAVELGDVRAPNLRLTPTMLLVASDGTVVEQWTGKQSKEGEDAVLETLETLRPRKE